MTNEKNYRSIILSRLKTRDRQCAQFSRIFASYDALSESFNHLLSKNNKAVLRKRSTTEGGDDDGEEVEKLQIELADVYKQKAINDQRLIDANLKLKDLEKQLAGVREERDIALKHIEELKKKLVEADKLVAETKETNQLMYDELIAQQTIYNAINQKFLKADEERNELIDRLKELKEREIGRLNEFNDSEQQRHLEKLRSALEDAAKPNPSLDPKALAVVDDCTATGCKIKFECNELGEVNDVLFHPNGNCAKKAVFTGANQGITRIDLDPECKHILGSSNDYAVRVWSVDDQRHRCAFTGHSDKVASAKFFNAGRFIVSGSNDRTVKLWDITSSRCTKTYFPGSTVLDVTSNDRFGAPIVTAHFDKSVRFWDIRSDAPCNTLKLNGKVTSLAVSVDGQNLLCSARDETLSLIDMRNYGIIHIYSAEQYRTSSDYGKCVISPGGTYVAAGSADGHVFIWNIITTRLEKVLYKGGHENAAVLSLAWHPSGSGIISGDKRKMLCLWR
uniref:Autophagy-related protein 16 domain-containing protein n=1 Tax=Ditylenchus dipsaci TaxID=166011 RepID=A0A915D7K1_9BILA